MAIPSQAATWSQPMMSASGCLAATARALDSARRTEVLVNLRCDHAKRQTEPLQKRSAVARRRRQDQHCGIGCSVVAPREVFVFTLFFDTV